MPGNKEGNKDAAVRGAAEGARSGRIAQMNYPVADGVEITFVPSGISGLVAVGTYVEEAARRLGVKLRGKCFARKGVHFCQFPF